jgi:hypothetical protein
MPPAAPVTPVWLPLLLLLCLSPVQVDGGGCLCVHADDVSTSLGKVGHTQLRLHNHLHKQTSNSGIQVMWHQD